jgi:hypothetical protein
VANWTPRLPDDALVIGGGTLRRTDLERSVETSIPKLGRPALSVFSAEVRVPADLIESAGARLRHPQLCLSSAGRLRVAGFELQQTFEPPHYSVWLDETNWREQLRAFGAAFDPPVRRGTLARMEGDPGRPST